MRHAAELSPDENQDMVAQRLAAKRKSRDKARQDTLSALFGDLPDWIQGDIHRMVVGLVDCVIDSKWQAEDIGRFMELICAERDEEIPTNFYSTDVLQKPHIYELAHIRWAISCGEIEGLRLLAGDRAELGAKRHRQVVEFGETRGQDQTMARKPEWERWRACAQQIWREHPELSKAEVARRVKKRLNLSEKPDTIGRHI
jgi:hypothetical protein